jgi:hypothetical protein
MNNHKQVLNIVLGGQEAPDFDAIGRLTAIEYPGVFLKLLDIQKKAARQKELIDKMNSEDAMNKELILIMNTRFGYIPAIKRYRELTGQSLKEGKEYIDALYLKHGILRNM